MKQKIATEEVIVLSLLFKLFDSQNASEKRLLYKKVGQYRSSKSEPRTGYSKMIGIVEQIGYEAVKVGSFLFVSNVLFFALVFHSHGQKLATCIIIVNGFF